ncbi:fibrinogen C domain-containing protein 1-like [Saccostrea cucullata]|uniref:fibrinogen C domain-containing protein 1-like n=1 Tax=Saccostrea cuccullata TaxID=36930 RepID=UPI002ED2A76B
MAAFLQVVIAGTRKYFADLAYDHRKSDSEFLSEYTARSLTFCTALCGFSCGCFGFNAKDKKCRVYNPCNQADITVAEAGWRNYFPEALPRDCHDLHVEDSVEFGVNQVYPFDNTTSLHVQCYMETNDTWWTVIQRRRSGSINFNRTWADYKGGFGNLGDSFWIGLDEYQNMPSISL